MMLLNHLGGILNYCRAKKPLGVVEAIDGNIEALLRRGRGYKNLRYPLRKAQRMAATRTEFVVFQDWADSASRGYDCCIPDELAFDSRRIPFQCIEISR
jgi:hypothetical protein